MKQSIGLCLGGGGARGFFHLGVINALRELNVDIKEISGCSIGAIIGGIYAANPDVDFSKITDDFNFIKLVQLRRSTPGIMNINKVKEYLEKIIGVNDFKDLKIKLIVNATEMHTAKEVVFKSGNLIDAILASIAVPGLFPPINKDKNKISLCDGGLVNLVPASHLRSKKIVISDLTFPLTPPGKPPSKTDILKAPVNIQLKRLVDLELQKIKDKNFVHLKLSKNMQMLDFRKSQTSKVLNEGFSTTMLNRQKILNL